eukprot:scaffold10861_cov180-Amphora_coffeaeformis.AAC.28
MQEAADDKNMLKCNMLSNLNSQIVRSGVIICGLGLPLRPSAWWLCSTTNNSLHSLSTPRGVPDEGCTYTYSVTCLTPARLKNAKEFDITA